ncbi:THAP domain-containing protein 2-like [Leptinotarsa decemlineata]|uniref:THAP domain-containing protein 2-like n=1 Tax=Leptinotarsa decemlineata TaxID=7539 RepID=UPI003D30C4BC
MVKCSSYYCSSNSEKKETGISFHRFPRNEDRRAIWVANMKISNWSPSKNDRICSKHFETCYFYRTEEKTKLLNEAVPTIFPERPSSLQSIQKNRKRIRPQTPEPYPSTSAQLQRDTPHKIKRF